MSYVIVMTTGNINVQGLHEHWSFDSFEHSKKYKQTNKQTNKQKKNPIPNERKQSNEQTNQSSKQTTDQLAIPSKPPIGGVRPEKKNATQKMRTDKPQRLSYKSDSGSETTRGLYYKIISYVPFEGNRMTRHANFKTQKPKPKPKPKIKTFIFPWALKSEKLKKKNKTKTKNKMKTPNTKTRTTNLRKQQEQQ